MRGYYVIPGDGDLIEFSGRNAKRSAFSRAKKIIENGDTDCIIQQFDDDNDDGYMAGLSRWTADEIMDI